MADEKLNQAADKTAEGDVEAVASEVAAEKAKAEASAAAAEKNVHDQVVGTASAINEKVDDLQNKVEDIAEAAAQKAQAVADFSEEHKDTISKGTNILLKVLGWVFTLYGIFYFIGFIIVLAAFLFQIKEVGMEGVETLYQQTTGGNLTQFMLILLGAQLVFLIASSFLGVRVGRALIKDNKRRAARLTPWILFFTVVNMAIDYMLSGPSTIGVSAIIQTILLLIMSVAIDPSLAAERVAEHKQEVAEDHAAAEKGMLGRDLTGKGYMRIDFFNCFWIFFVCCILGLILEIIWHMTVVDPGVYQDRAGLLIGPFSPIYGFGAVLISMALNRLYNKNIILTFFVAGFVGAGFEFLTAVFMKAGFGVTAWDYSSYQILGQPDPIAVFTGGKTSTMFYCIWGILGLVWVHLIMPLMLKVINEMPWKLRYSLTTVVAILMLADCLMTLGSFDCWYERECGVQPETPIEQFYADHYDNEWMANRFQSMTMNTKDATRTDTADKLASKVSTLGGVVSSE